MNGQCSVRCVVHSRLVTSIQSGNRLAIGSFLTVCKLQVDYVSFSDVSYRVTRDLMKRTVLCFVRVCLCMCASGSIDCVCIHMHTFELQFFCSNGHWAVIAERWGSEGRRRRGEERRWRRDPRKLYMYMPTAVTAVYVSWHFVCGLSYQL